MVRWTVRIIAIVILILGAARICIPANSDKTIHQSLHAIGETDTTNGDMHVCTAYAVGPRVLITASHCLLDQNYVFAVDGKLRPVDHISSDGFDHSLIFLADKIRFKAWVVMYQYQPPSVTRIHAWCHPFEYNMVDQYHQGYVSGSDSGPLGKLTVFIFPGVHGDSGCLFFDSDGKVVGMLSYVKLPFSAGYPIAFTTKQLRDARYY